MARCLFLVHLQGSLQFETVVRMALYALRFWHVCLRFQQLLTRITDIRIRISKQINTVLPLCLVSLSKTCYFIMPPFCFFQKQRLHIRQYYSTRGAGGSVVAFVHHTPRTRVRFRPVARGFFTLLDGLTSIIISGVPIGLNLGQYCPIQNPKCPIVFS